ncbi:hypothetical protein WJX79_000393 [Trebouxia sp. C0005]
MAGSTLCSAHTSTGLTFASGRPENYHAVNGTLRRLHLHKHHCKLQESHGQIREAKCSLFKWFSGGNQVESQQTDAPDVVDKNDLPFPPSILDTTHLRGRDLALAYKATEHGWGALQFHERCNMKGPCVVYAVTSAGARFGGFNSEGFKSSDDYSPSSKAFLFCWPQSEEDPVILRKIGGTEAALFDYGRGGPQWGADALVIGPPQAPVMGGISGPDSPTLGAGDLHSAKCRLGLAYELLPKYLKQTSLFGGSEKTATLAEVEVYFSPEIAALY